MDDGVKFGFFLYPYFFCNWGWGWGLLNFCDYKIEYEYDIGR